MSASQTLFSLTTLAAIAHSKGVERRMRIEHVCSLRGRNGDVNVSCAAGGRSRKVMTVGVGRIRFARAPYTETERRTIHCVLRVFDRRAKLHVMTGDGKRTRLEIFGAMHPLDLTNSHTALVGNALDALRPPWWGASISPALEGELY